MTLNEKQLLAVKRAKDGKSIFLTGSAGCGKSYTLDTIVTELRIMGKQVAVTASTGAAALLIGGRTIHSFLGIGLGEKSARDLAAGCFYLIAKKLQMIDTIILDEVSMISAELIQKISDYLGILRKNPQPFGGVQMIFCGDLFQLPPVRGDYCFMANAWKEAKIQTVELDQIYRQTDEEFRDLLERARKGEITELDIELLKNHQSQIGEDMAPTKLFSRNVDVDTINNEELDKLITEGAETRVFKTVYSNQVAEKWANSVGVKTEIKLCVGAQVMLTRNLDIEVGLVNGSRGVVTAFLSGGNGVYIKFSSGTHLIQMNTLTPDLDDKKTTKGPYVLYMPLLLAWAITISKAQGCTLDCVEMDLGGSIFANGQAYTALSRARSLQTTNILQVNKDSFRADQRVVDFYSNSQIKFTKNGNGRCRSTSDSEWTKQNSA